MARLTISLFGPFHATRDGQAIPGLRAATPRALMAFLAAESDREHTRRKLADLLWPELDDRTALSNLRYALSDLRRAIGDADSPTAQPLLCITREMVRLDTSADCLLDVREFERLSRVALTQSDPNDSCASLEAAVSLYRGPFLEGLAPADSSAFEDWLFWTREHYQRSAVEVLSRLTACLETAGRLEEARSAARRLVQLEPLDERAHRQYMRALARCGQRNAALAHYERWRATLADELDAQPMHETMALYEAIRADALTPPHRDYISQSVALPRASLDLHALPTPDSEPLFVAREDEMAQLDRHLADTLEGRGRIVFVTGDAGSGKSALMREFIHRALARHAGLVAVTGSCNAATGLGDPYQPFREILRVLSGDIEAPRAAGAIGTEHAHRLWSLLPRVVQTLVEQGPGLIDLFVPGADLLLRADSMLLGRGGADWHDRLVELSHGQLDAPARQRTDICEQATRVFGEISCHAPLVLILDDLQWLDKSSADLLFHLGRHLTGKRLLILAACRMPDVALGRGAERHPLALLMNELGRIFGEVEINLDQTDSRVFVEAYLDSEPNRLGVSFRDTLHAHTGGHALFTIESLHGLQERGDLVRDATGAWVEGPSLDWRHVPPRVEAIIAERIGRLPPDAQTLLTAASVEGEEFTAEVAAQVAGIGRPEAMRLLSTTLSKQHRLVHAEKVIWPSEGKDSLSRYRFQNALFRDYLYRHLDPVECAQLHELTGVALEQTHDGQLSGVAMQLARHFELAGLTSRAADYWIEAGREAMRLFAYREAQADFKHALDLLATLSETPARAQRALRADLAQASAWAALGGWGGAGRAGAAQSALSLSGQAGGLTNAINAMLLDANVQTSRGSFARAFETGQQMLRAAESSGDRQATMLAHFTLGVTDGFAGELAAAHRALESSLSLYQEDEDGNLCREIVGDVKAGLLAWLCLSSWAVGYPEQASRYAREARARAKLAEQSLLLGTVLQVTVLLDIIQRTTQEIPSQIAELCRLVEEEKLEPHRPLAEFYRGWLLVSEGKIEEGLGLMRHGLGAHPLGGTRVGVVGFLTVLAQTCLETGRSQAGLEAISEAFSWMQTGIGHFFESRVHELRGALLLQTCDALPADDPARRDLFTAAEASFSAAIEVARGQSARGMELSAATRLADLWQRHGRTAEARQLLGEIYVWFTEGFDMPDLREARVVLEQLDGQLAHLLPET